MSWNSSLFQFIHSFAGQSKFLDDLGIFFANYVPYLMVLAVLYFVFRKNAWKNKWLMFTVMALSVILARGIFAEIIRFIWPHLRPFDALSFQPLIPESGPSFPSGHASIFFSLSASIFYFDKRWGIWFFILSLLNGLARIFVGVHWPLDIVGGIIVGLFSFWVAKMLLKNYLPKKLSESKTPA